MTYSIETEQLSDYDDEDIFDVVVKLGKSFHLEFENDAFRDVKTLGDLCDVFESYLTYQHRDDCTKQQAFYRVRKAISFTQDINEDQITPDSSLATLFPSHKRKSSIKTFKKYLGADIKLLTYPDWIALILVIVFIFSLIAFFFNWRIAISGIVISITASKVGNLFGKTLAQQTVRGLTEQLYRENYIDIRRAQHTINRKEVAQIIIDTFSHDLALDKANLTRDAKFSWAE
jgi:hypothetical protein